MSAFGISVGEPHCPISLLQGINGTNASYNWHFIMISSSRMLIFKWDEKFDGAAVKVGHFAWDPLALRIAQTLLLSYDFNLLRFLEIMWTGPLLLFLAES